jgi:HK97 family phage major capsid protein
MADDIKVLGERWQKAFEVFKATNDAKLAEVEKKGAASADLTEKLVKLNEDLEKCEKEFNARLDQMEKSQKRLPEDSGSPADEMAMKRKAAFNLFLRRGDVTLSSEEKKALTSYSPSEQKALISSDDTGGGYLAPPEFDQSIIKTVTEFSPVRQVARVRSTSARASRHPKRTGQFAAAWVSEIGTRAETTGLKYGMEEIPNHEFYARVDVSVQDLEDAAFDLESELRQEFAEQFAVAEGTAFVKGSGVGKPEGILTCATIGYKPSTGASYTIVADDLITVYYSLKSGYSAQAKWLVNRGQLAVIRALKATTTGEYLWQPGLSGGLPPTILGAQYLECPDLDIQVSGQSGKHVALFGDFRRGYVISDRVQIQVVRDPYTVAETGCVKFVARKRVGGQVVLPEAICRMTTA